MIASGPAGASATGFDFLPDAGRARSFDLRMRARLADSLEHVFEQSREALRIDEGLAQRLLAGLRGAERFRPLVFALYYDLVDAILADRLVDAQALMDAILLERPIPGDRQRVIVLDDADLGAGNASRYGRMMDTDPVSPFAFTAPSAEAVAAFRPRLEEALTMMKEGAPRLRAELDALVSEIVLADGRSGLTESSFTGGSSFLLWGALFINPASSTTAVSLVETLAHEAAHSLLFGFAVDEPLVLNPDSERFTSPFRDDPRPMDGIYHATFVAARMHYAAAQHLPGALGTPQEEAAIRSALDYDRHSFQDGFGTIAAHGRLSATGKAVIESARRYMDGAAT